MNELEQLVKRFREYSRVAAHSLNNPSMASAYEGCADELERLLPQYVDQVAELEAQVAGLEFEVSLAAYRDQW